MRTTYLILDDFYPNPDAVRAEALAQPFHQDLLANYPGLHHAPTASIQPVIQELEGRLCTKLYWPPSQPQGHFRIAMAQDREYAKVWVHTDGVDLTALVYLTPGLPPDSGTTIYRHKSTGLLRLGDPTDPEMQTRLAELKCSWTHLRDRTEFDTHDATKWEIVEQIAYRYNRMLVFDSNHFHSAGKLYGDSLLTGRLTQNFFFHTRPISE